MTPKKTKKGKSKSPRNKENALPQLDWRDGDDYGHKASKSKGISPKIFHGGNNNNNNNTSRSRSRPGKEFVKVIHEQSQENELREEKREISKLQQIKRSAFKEVTSLKTWPLQELAMQDYQQLLQVYMGLQNSVDMSHGTVEPEYNHGGSSESGASTDKKRAMTDKSLSPSKSQQKQRYKNDFLEELDIPDHNVVTPSFDPARRFDPGLWSMEPRIFSTEKANGKRRYVVGHMGRVADLIWRKTDKCNRHFYELILEDTPCRLYFDLEYSIPDNTNIPEDDLLEEFYEELKHALILQFPDHTEGFDWTCIVDLDSSTPQKFSRHWIVHLPSKALFKSSHEVGKFVKSFIQKLADDLATGQLLDRCPCLHDYLFVNPKGTAKEKESNKSDQDLPLSKKTCFVDLGVYTRNRLFRLIGSSKFGKSPECALRLASTNKYPVPRGFGNELFYVPAMINSENCGDVVQVDEEDDDDHHDEQRDKALEKFKAQTDWSLHAQVLCRTLVVPLNVHKIDYPLLPEIQEAEGSLGTTSRQHAPTSSLSSTRISRPSFGSSPYPYLDDYVLNVLAVRGGIQGAIRAWTLDYGPNDSDYNQKRIPVGISFQMSRNRWCECIGRAHRSNNVIWNVDFGTHQCVQSCYDPECRAMNFRGSPIDLPCDVVQKLDDALFEEQIAQMDEQELLGEVNPSTVDIAKSSQTKQSSCCIEDQEFEKAMKALTLGGNAKKLQAESSTGADQSQRPPHLDDSLSDDALLNAISGNPELFP